ncbi:hypothetical protein GLYMA_02G291750v4 [Glycine max]|nr:hypothetical protein GLYMA_02G291750v4 [Glycine max]
MRGMLLRGFKEKHVQVEQERELALKALQFFMDRDVHVHIYTSCVSNLMSTFAGGRLIQDNTVIAHEDFHALKRRSKLRRHKWNSPKA